MSEPATSPSPVQTAKELLKNLAQEFKVIREFAPLAIGIDKQLVACQPAINRKLLRAALGMHTKSIRYLKNLQTATVRFNLDESPADAVSDEQRTLAAKTLHEHFKKRAEQHKAQVAAEAAERQHAEKLSQLMEKFSRK